MPFKALASAPRRKEVALAHRQRGGMIAAVLPIHYPRELLRAFNILPMEVWGPPHVEASQGAVHLQSYVCSIARNSLAFIKTGGLDVADVLVVPHTCDSLQGLGSILIDFVSPRQTVLPIYLPRGRDERDLNFLTEELRSLYHRLEEICKRSPSSDDLLACIDREERADQLLARLHARRKDLPASSLDFYRLVRLREYLPAERFSPFAEEALRNAKDSHHPGIPVVLSGIVPEPVAVLESIDRMGGWVAADDLACCGRRVYPEGKSADPFRRMAERMLGAPPCPTLGSPIETRLQHLLNLARAADARAVIFYDMMFCEPELFDLPALREGLQQAGLPSLAVQVDLSDPLSQQMLTRLEAFFEMIT